MTVFMYRVEGVAWLNMYIVIMLSYYIYAYNSQFLPGR